MDQKYGSFSTFTRLENCDQYMQRCIDLASKGLGHVAPNPMVGCVIVEADQVIGEGYHEHYGGVHAEPNAVNSVKNQELLKRATLYVSLEPCSHFGKTPPCTDLIVNKQIPNVVIGALDTNPLVNGRGIAVLRNAGVQVTTGILGKECRELNKRFFTYHEKKRPYIILKWAETKNGFMDWKREITAVGQQLIINNEKVNEEVHKWRSHEQAILIGTNTALLDNPRLNVRLTEGQNPIRVVIDRSLQIPSHYRLMDASIPTFVFTDREMPDSLNKEYISIPRSIPVIEFILSELYKRNIQSLLVEGGAKLLNSFIQKSLWDEARVISSLMTIEDGVKSPVLENNQPVSVTGMDNNNISFYFNKNSTPFIPIF